MRFATKVVRECDWLRLNLSLWRLTGRGRYLDEAERCLKGHFIFNQFPNGGAGHRTFHQIDGQAGGFQGRRRRGLVVLQRALGKGRSSISPASPSPATEQGPCINLVIDCEGSVAGPGGKWKVTLRETEDGLRIVLAKSRRDQGHGAHPSAGVGAARAPDREAGGALLERRRRMPGWSTACGTAPRRLRASADGSAQRSRAGRSGRAAAGPRPAGRASRAGQRLAAGSLPHVRPVVLWSAALPAKDGRIVVPASLKADADPTRPEQWKLLELAPLRAVAGQPHEAAWFSFQLRPGFTGVLGRMATYSGQVVRWDEAVARGPGSCPKSSTWPPRRGSCPTPRAITPRPCPA